MDQQKHRREAEMDLNLTPTKQNLHNGTESNCNKEKYEIGDKVEIPVSCQSFQSHISVPLDKFDVIINSTKNIEKMVFSINSNFEKLLAIFTMSNIKYLVKEDCNNLKGGLEPVLKEEGLDLGSSKDGLLNSKFSNEKGENANKRSSSSPFTNYCPTNSSMPLQQSAKRKLDMKCEINEKTSSNSNGPPELPQELINFHYEENRFPSQLPTLKEIPLKKIKALYTQMNKNNKKTDTPKKRSVKKSSVGHPSSSDHDDDGDLKARSNMQKDKGENRMSPTKNQSDNTVLHSKGKMSKPMVKCFSKDEEDIEYMEFDDDIDIAMHDIPMKAQCRKSKKKKVRYEMGDYLSKITKENKFIPDTYKQYLAFLTPQEKTICVAIAETKETTTICYETSGDPIQVIDILCVFPEKWLTGSFIDIYLYDIHLNQEPKSKKLILPTSFQYRVIEIYLKPKRISRRGNFVDFHERIVSNFLASNDYTNVEQVYVPLNDKEGLHWFLLVINLVERKNYILDSLGFDKCRVEIVEELLSKIPHVYGGDSDFEQLLKDVGNFAIETHTTPLQQNYIDCGMYVLKYIEANENSDWSKIFYTTDSMGIERLKCVAKLITSKHNKCVHFKHLSTG